MSVGGTSTSEASSGGSSPVASVGGFEPPQLITMVMAKINDMAPNFLKTCIDYPFEISGLFQIAWQLISHD
ncbi:MAG: hypothetical protein BWX66_01500 [Deltaproteobacteria bacterium ADurb.Bin058]|nr:MAG: hypothetical protein BWX66_01500 [Deltaproteobacteria bacterium ADurb.Bin058]